MKDYTLTLVWDGSVDYLGDTPTYGAPNLSVSENTTADDSIIVTANCYNSGYNASGYELWAYTDSWGKEGAMQVQDGEILGEWRFQKSFINLNEDVHFYVRAIIPGEEDTVYYSDYTEEVTWTYIYPYSGPMAIIDNDDVRGCYVLSAQPVDGYTGEITGYRFVYSSDPDALETNNYQSVMVDAESGDYLIYRSDLEPGGNYYVWCAAFYDNGMESGYGSPNMFAGVAPGPDDPHGDEDPLRVTVDMSGVNTINTIVVDFSRMDNFSKIIRVILPNEHYNSIDVYCPTDGSWYIRGGNEAHAEWEVNLQEVSENMISADPRVVESNGDGVPDVFFANPTGVWGSGYVARHTGCVNTGWEGTDETIALQGKNRFLDVFYGSDDSNILLLTDDMNGDGFFLDDIYTPFPEEVNPEENGARVAQIREIRAGNGDDVVDLTSARYEYMLSEDLTIFGGDGDDVLWANGKSAHLFGDSGDDKMVGTSGMDTFAGGSGNDEMYGAGGSDLFAFGSAFGQDIVKQDADGFVTLWFAEGNEQYWDADTMVYSDGLNTVTVQGVTSDKVTLLFGNDAQGDAEMYQNLVAYGAFADFSTDWIFSDESSYDGQMVQTVRL